MHVIGILFCTLEDQIGNEELVGYFKKLGVDMTSNEAQKLVNKYVLAKGFADSRLICDRSFGFRRIDRNGSLMIEPDEWRQYFFLVPIDNLDELLYHWRYSAVRSCLRSR